MAKFEELSFAFREKKRRPFAPCQDLNTFFVEVHDKLPCASLQTYLPLQPWCISRKHCFVGDNMVAILPQPRLANPPSLSFSTSTVPSPPVTRCQSAKPSRIRIRRYLRALHEVRTATAASPEDDSVHTRRNLLRATLAAAVVPSVPCLAGAGPFPMMEEPDLPRFQRTATGVKIQEVVEGEGPVAAEGDTVVFNYVCRRSNGYFVYSTVDQFSGESRPVILPLGAGKMIVGLREVLLGMKPGGKRRAVVPPEVGYISADLEPQPREFGPQRSLFSHAQEPLLFEVQLLKIK